MARVRRALCLKLTVCPTGDLAKAGAVLLKAGAVVLKAGRVPFTGDRMISLGIRASSV